ncbi:membrane protein [Yersinia massiliensis]|uniref:DUF2207 domain-containing protein n=1 Tax=Yersinia massiliensis TaxID=419257 RepID=UPI0005DB837C|nr:DUF2207 domain-containing protein [Yersinia massiliensis]CNH78148.1 membrane protein [Yersinia massiliensis]
MATLLAVIRRGWWLLLILGSPLSLAETQNISVSEVSVVPAGGHEVEPDSPQDPWVTPSVGEHILLFDTQVYFAEDGTMLVDENIQVLSTGEQIKRGIFRTLPLSWQRPDEKIFNVDYQIKQVLRDGVAEPFIVDKNSKRLKLQIGSADHLLSPGIYHYKIQYKVRNHFSRFPNWDELYWNVTGNGWDYPIDKIRFSLQLPEQAKFLTSTGKDSRLKSIDVYTGPVGWKGDNARVLADGSVETIQPMGKGEGLTVAYTWPRDILAAAPAPQAVSPWRHMLLPTMQTCVLWIPLLLLAFYYLSWWRKNVITPQLKMPTVVPLYAIPKGFSPGYARYVNQRNYDDAGFTSDLLDLIAKRGMAITQKVSQTKPRGLFNRTSVVEQCLTRLPENASQSLTVDDRKILSLLFPGKNGKINLSKAHQKPMQNARRELENRCVKQQAALFCNRGKTLWLGLFITLLTPVLCGVFFDVGMAIVTIFILLFLWLGVILLSFPLRFLFNPRAALNRWNGFAIFFALLVGTPITLMCGFALFSLHSSLVIPAGYPGALLGCALLCLLFAIKAPRYSQKGLNSLAIVNGLKRYLSAAEEHRYETLYPPDKLVAHFESMLPYALALDVGKTWANTFTQYLINHNVMSEVFDDVDWYKINNFSQSCRTSSMSAPSPVSRSNSSSSYSSSSRGSGSSGRGSSGGGAGGGGGGGW